MGKMSRFGCLIRGLAVPGGRAKAQPALTRGSPPTWVSSPEASAAGEELLNWHPVESQNAAFVVLCVAGLGPERVGQRHWPALDCAALPQLCGRLGWLIAHSTSFDNHAIHRGKWIRERLLGGVVPDIPITVDAQLPNAPEKTLRERMNVTRQEYCWKCHQLMNNTGLPFEQFDHFGRFRTTETVLDPEATAKNVDKKNKPLGPGMRSVPLDTTGLIAHVGDPNLEGAVKDPVQLVKKLASSERVEQVFVRHAFRYWMGRNESPGDAVSLQAAHKAYKESNGSMKALITALLTSESFLYRVPSALDHLPGEKDPSSKRRTP